MATTLGTWYLCELNCSQWRHVVVQLFTKIPAECSSTRTEKRNVSKRASWGLFALTGGTCFYGGGYREVEG